MTSLHADGVTDPSSRLVEERVAYLYEAGRKDYERRPDLAAVITRPVPGVRPTVTVDHRDQPRTATTAARHTSPVPSNPELVDTTQVREPVTGCAMSDREEMVELSQDFTTAERGAIGRFHSLAPDCCSHHRR